MPHEGQVRSRGNPLSAFPGHEETAPKIRGRFFVGTRELGERALARKAAEAVQDEAYLGATRPDE